MAHQRELLANLKLQGHEVHTSGIQRLRLPGCGTQGIEAANGYYTGGGEPDGIWWNPAGLLGLQHGATVGTDAFYRLCDGFSPDGEKLTQNAGSEKRSAGLDLTFSADKSVSAVWAVAGERLRTAIADAHTAAVRYTLEHVIEAHCATTRIRTRAA